MLDLSFWFYTFSAIPQTLGAIIGFFAVFVVYKQTRVHDFIGNIKNDVRYFLLVLHPTQEIHQLEHLSEDEFLELLKTGLDRLNPKQTSLGFSGYDRLRDLMSEVITSWKRFYSADENRIYAFLLERHLALEKLINIKKQIYGYLNKVATIGGVSIVYSLILLPFGPKVLEILPNLAWCLVLGGVILGVFSTVYSVYSVSRVTKL